MIDKATEGAIRMKYAALRPVLDEKARRMWAATEVRSLPRGGLAAVVRATGLAKTTILRGMAYLAADAVLPPGRVRRSGAGRPKASLLDPGLSLALERLVEPTVRGDPESPLRWTCKSTRKLAAELKQQGYDVSHSLVADLLHDAGYSLQANRKSREGKDHPDRDAQFRHINRRMKRQLCQGEPAISVDTKKKELVGDFKNHGREWRPKGQPEEVRVHDFLDRTKGKAIPYGVYDLGSNSGWVSVGIDHDTSAFAVHTIRRWWKTMGRKQYPAARTLLITADSGGSNGVRVRLWKWELQKLANEIQMSIRVSHLPPGTSKWNKIEHRLFSFITQNWRGKPLLSHATIVNLISNTRTETGLHVRCVLDRRKYPKQVKVTDEQMEKIAIKRDRFHGDWNYTIHPNR